MNDSGSESNVLSERVAALEAELAATRTAEASARRTSEVFRYVMNNVPHVIFWKDREYRFAGGNDNFAKTLGRPLAEIIGKTDYDFFDKEMADHFRRYDTEIVESGVGLNDIEEPLALPDGKIATLLTSKVPMRDASGSVTGMLGIFADITRIKDLESDLRRAYDDLAKNHAKLREIPRQIQSSILPQRFSAPPFEVAGALRAADEIGGDYYDVIPTENAVWIGIGDVAGHGLEASTVMLMLQSVVAGLVRATPDSEPAAIVAHANEVLFENIRRRMGGDQHVTFTLLRIAKDGHVSYAGAHEDLIVYRHATKRCELLRTDGTWLGAIASIRAQTLTAKAKLEAGDVLVTYTDGITEARGASERFGLEALVATIEGCADQPAEAICARVFDAVASFRLATPDETSNANAQEDDEAVVALRFGG